MDKLRRYIIQHFSLQFFSIFLALIAIASVVFLIKLSSYTAVIKLTFLELLKLYVFVLPELLIFTIPITFFITAVLTLYKFSTDNEMIVMFALGIKPGYIIKVLAFPALLLSLIMLFNTIVLIPHTKVLSKNFIVYKKQEAQFNLSASEFGHNFNNWLLYIGKSDEKGQYQDILLFRKDKKEEILVGADHAEVLTQKGIFKLMLTSGQGYSYSEESLTQIDFETMHINNIMTEDYYTYRNTIDYWLHPHWRDYKIKKFVTHGLLALFPLVSLFTILSIGILHTRHQKGHVYLFLAVATLLYIGLVFGLVKPLGLWSMPAIVITWLFVSYLLYRRNILARY
jgi:lipopolysaccharide export system permease protein